MPKDGDWLFRKAVMKAGLLDDATLKKYEREVYLGDLETPGARLPDVLIWHGILTPDQVGKVFGVLNATLATCVDCGVRRYVAADGKRHARCRRCRLARRRAKAAAGEGLAAAAPAERVDLKGPCLASLHKGEFGEFHFLTRGPITLGRGKECDIVVGDKRASRRHTRISTQERAIEAADFYETAAWSGAARDALKGAEIVVEDLESRNGTRVNGMRVTSHTFMPGDILRIGHNCIVFLLPGMPVTRAHSNALGWVHGLTLDGKPVRLPVTRVPLLLGRAELADVRITTSGTPHLAAQVVASPKGAVFTDLTGDLPRMRLLRDGEEFAVGSQNLHFSIENPDATADAAGYVDDPEIASWNAEVTGLDLREVLEAEAERANDEAGGEKIPGRPTARPVIAGQAPRNVCITARSGPCKGETFLVGMGDTVIGRMRNTGIYLNDTLVSRRHAGISRRNGALVIEDLGSENGTLVNGEAVQQRVLQPGDIVRIGASEFLVHL